MGFNDPCTYGCPAARCYLPSLLSPFGTRRAAVGRPILITDRVAPAAFVDQDLFLFGPRVGGRLTGHGSGRTTQDMREEKESAG